MHGESCDVMQCAPRTLQRATPVASSSSLPSRSLTPRVTRITTPTSGALLPGCRNAASSPKLRLPPGKYTCAKSHGRGAENRAENMWW